MGLVGSEMCIRDRIYPDEGVVIAVITNLSNAPELGAEELVAPFLAAVER